MLYNDVDTSMVQVNFSRLDKDNEIILTGDVTYLLVNKDGNWKLKGGFSQNLATLGNDWKIIKSSDSRIRKKK